MSALTPMTLTTYDRPSTMPEIARDHGLGRARRPRRPGRSARSSPSGSMDVVGSLLRSDPAVPRSWRWSALLIRLESPGPILFRQQRMGLGGRVFWCLKFRTMVPDAEQRLRDLEARNESAGGVLFKIKDDPRITPLGRFLRRTSLDELPAALERPGRRDEPGRPPPLAAPRQREARRSSTPKAMPAGCRSSRASPAPGRWAAGAKWTAAGCSGSTWTMSRTGRSASTWRSWSRRWRRPRRPGRLLTPEGLGRVTSPRPSRSVGCAVGPPGISTRPSPRKTLECPSPIWAKTV